MDKIRSPPEKVRNLEEIINILKKGFQKSKIVKGAYLTSAILGMGSYLQYLNGYRDLGKFSLVGAGILLYQAFGLNYNLGRYALKRKEGF